MFKFYLDGTEVESPENWKEIQLNVQRDSMLNYTFITFKGEVVFKGQSFNYLKTIYDSNGYCNSVPFDLWSDDCNNGSFTPFAYLQIFLSDIKFNLHKCEAAVELVDSNWGTYIQNNKQIKTSISLPATKNGIEITPAQTEVFETFQPSDGAYIGSAVGVSLHEMFRYLIGWMSDKKITFVSDYFLTGEGKDYTICTGASLRTGNFTSPVTSFWYAYTELNKKLKLGVSYYTINGQKIIRIENYDYFLSSGNVITLEDIVNIVLTTNTKEMYSSLRAGSQNVYELGQCDNGNTECTFSQVPFYTWADDSLAVFGECNVETVADLVTANDWIIDNNIIEDCVVYGNDNQDRNIFLISIDRATMKAKQTDFFGIGKYWYNDSLANYNVYINWFKGLPNFSNSWVNQTNGVDFYAGLLAQTYCCNGGVSDCFNLLGCPDFGVIFANVNAPYYDVNGNNNNGLFIPPYSGNYEIQFSLTYTDNRPVGFNFGAVYQDLTTNTAATPPIFAVLPSGGGSVTSNLDTAFLIQGHKYAVWIVGWNGELIFTDGWLRVKAVLPNPFPNVPTNNFLAKNYSFEKFVTMDQLKSIINNPSGKVAFSGSGLGAFEEGWMKQVNINIQTLEGDFVIGSL